MDLIVVGQFEAEWMKEVIHRRDAERRRGGAESIDSTLCAISASLRVSAVRIEQPFTQFLINPLTI
jgi:hypothetical protein